MIVEGGNNQGSEPCNLKALHEGVVVVVGLGQTILLAFQLIQCPAGNTREPRWLLF